MSKTITLTRHCRRTAFFSVKKFIAAVFFLLFVPFILEASHFRYGNISWSNTSGNTVVFRIQQGWRLSASPFGGYTPALGVVIPTGTFEFGDGTYEVTYITVTSVNTAEDWFFGEQTITKTYDNPGIRTVFFQSCCRINDVLNNADGSFRVESVVNVGSGNSSPVSTLTPIVYLSAGNPSASFQVPAFDPNGSPLSFSLATAAQAANGESYDQPAGLTVSNTGLVSFSTAGKTPGELYTSQLIISDGTATTALDYLIRIVPTGNPPVFDYSVTPANGFNFTVNTGSTLTFDIKATDPDNQTVSISAAGVPAGAGFTPSIPVSGNPVSTQFSWTPGPMQGGDYLIVFEAIDADGIPALTDVRIHVPSPVDPLSLSEIHTDISCSGSHDGSIDLTVSGGTAPFTYSWSNGLTTQDLSGLTAGIYSVTVTDANGTNKSLSVTIINTNPLISYLGNLANYLLVFTNGNADANWQGASKGFIGNVAVDGIQATERTSGTVPYAGTIFTNNSTVSTWQHILSSNTTQSSSSVSEISLLASLENDLESAFGKINILPVTPTFENRSAISLNNLNTKNGNPDLTVINVTSGFQVSGKIIITGDASDLFILRWDNDANFSNGYNGQVKFQSGGAIVPQGGLTAANFIHAAGDINASGGGSNPPLPYPQGPRMNNGTGSLISGGADFNGGGFFTGYWLTTGAPTIFNAGQPYGQTAPLSNAIFAGGWYSKTTKFSMTSGTGGVYVGGCSQINPRITIRTEIIAESMTANSFNVSSLSNPSNKDFNLHITSNSSEPIMIRMIDISGKVYSAVKLNGTDSYVSVGGKLTSGIYFAEVKQGNNRKIIKLVKVN